MKKIYAFMSVFALLAISMMVGASAKSIAYADESVNITAKSCYLVDYNSGTVMYQKNEEEKLPIASMVKIMTLNIVFEEINNKTISSEQKIVVSNDAAGMGGSQMFLDAGKEYKVSDLIKGIVVVSANDASYALAETISGTVDSFIVLMNQKAKEYGMQNTNFVNVTGLPKEGQYSTAKDVSIMTRKLLAHPQYYNYSKIYMEDFTHADGRVTGLVNTNKLIKFYNGCDSGKTGFTSDAKFCLSASAYRNNMRVVATVLGVENSKTRFKEVTDLFNYAFNKYENDVVLKKDKIIPNDIRISNGSPKEVNITVDKDLSVLSRKGKKPQYSVKFELKEGLKAPIEMGDMLGKVRIVDQDGNAIAEANIIAASKIEKENFFDILMTILKNLRKLK